MIYDKHSVFTLKWTTFGQHLDYITFHVALVSDFTLSKRCKGQFPV